MSNDSICVSLLRAMKERHKCKNIIHERQRLLVFRAGLNWKSSFQEVRKHHLLSSIPTWVAINLGVGVIYPPPGHWTTETDDIFNIWNGYLATCKMHDKQTRQFPVC